MKPSDFDGFGVTQSTNSFLVLIISLYSYMISVDQHINVNRNITNIPYRDIFISILLDAYLLFNRSLFVDDFPLVDHER